MPQPLPVRKGQRRECVPRRSAFIATHRHIALTITPVGRCTQVSHQSLAARYPLPDQNRHARLCVTASAWAVPSPLTSQRFAHRGPMCVLLIVSDAYCNYCDFPFLKTNQVSQTALDGVLST